MATLYRRRVHAQAARYAALQSEGGGAGARASETPTPRCHHATSLLVYIFFGVLMGFYVETAIV